MVSAHITLCPVASAHITLCPVVSREHDHMQCATANTVPPNMFCKCMDETVEEEHVECKIHTNSLSSFKRYCECDCKNYCCTSKPSDLVKCIGSAVVKITAALAHVVM